MSDIVKKSNGNGCGGIGKGGMPRLLIEIGKEYNWLTVIDKCLPHDRPPGRTDIFYKCRCRCGTEVLVSGSHLKSGHNKSCGCMTTRLKYSILDGDIFGKLTVVGRRCAAARTGGRRHTTYKCKCSCGKETWVLGRNLYLGNTKSCGCGLVFNSHYKGFFGHIPFVVFNHWKLCAKRRNIPFNLTIEYMNDLFVKQKSRCAVSGLKIGFGPKTNSVYSRTASLDRIDSNGGYEIGNVWWVHKDVNIMKLDHSMTYFTALCKKVAEYNK